MSDSFEPKERGAAVEIEVKSWSGNGATTTAAAIIQALGAQGFNVRADNTFHSAFGLEWRIQTPAKPDDRLIIVRERSIDRPGDQREASS